ncbi:hypothetical protein K438DRAFT_1990772 [Mycena galopus ATCC 62051]|nr:hypothetical protein K438DRAFT_1990772 [Mycena galopus ATCC 62051]
MFSGDSLVIDDDDKGFEYRYSPVVAWLFNGIGGCNNCEAPDAAAGPGEGSYQGTLYYNQDNQQSQGPPLTATASVTFLELLGISNLTTFIDGEAADTFVHTPTGQGSFLFNTTVFTSRVLPLGSHTLPIQNGQTGGRSSLAILDFVTRSKASQSSLAIAPFIAAVSPIAKISPPVEYFRYLRKKP